MLLPLQIRIWSSWLSFSPFRGPQHWLIQIYPRQVLVFERDDISANCSVDHESLSRINLMIRFFILRGPIIISDSRVWRLFPLGGERWSRLSWGWNLYLFWSFARLLLTLIELLTMSLGTPQSSPLLLGTRSSSWILSLSASSSLASISRLVWRAACISLISPRCFQNASPFQLECSGQSHLANVEKQMEGDQTTDEVVNVDFGLRVRSGGRSITNTRTTVCCALLENSVEGLQISMWQRVALNCCLMAQNSSPK